MTYEHAVSMEEKLAAELRSMGHPVWHAISGIMHEGLLEFSVG